MRCDRVVNDERTEWRAREVMSTSEPSFSSTRPRCPAPADLSVEQAAYEGTAEVGVWAGPNYRMHFRRLGSGPPLLLVPGIAATHKSYALLLNRLAQSFTTIHYDYPGMDAEDGARLSKIGHGELAEDLVGLLDHLQLGQVFLLGISFGVTVSLCALGRWPERFPRAVLQGGFAYRPYTIAERMALGLGRQVPGTVERLPFREKILEWNSRDVFPTAMASRWGEYVEDNGRTRIAGLAHRCGLLTRLDLRPRLGSIRTPILVIQGNEDRIVPRLLHEELVRGLPCGEAKVVPLAGHPMHYTHAELLTQMAAEFLLERGAAEGRLS